MEINVCVSFLLIKNGRILLEKRSKSKETDSGLITLPGGHIENDENRDEALRRELMEELGVAPVSFGFLCTLFHSSEELQLIHYYVVSKWQGKIEALEADEVNWYPVNDAPVNIDADMVALGEYKRLFNKVPSLF